MSGNEAGRRFEAWRESELQRDLQSAERWGPEGWVHTAAACYLIFCAPLVIFLPLLRAAEVSRTWEVALWFVAASAGLLAALVYRQGKANSDRAEAIRGELKHRRESRAGIEPVRNLAHPVNPPKSAHRYRVLSYDVSEEPAGEPPTVIAGEFDDAAAALACARLVVERDMSTAGSDGTAAGIFSQYMSFGEGALIFGEPRIEFDCYEHARQHAETIARRLSAPKGQAE